MKKLALASVVSLALAPGVCSAEDLPSPEAVSALVAAPTVSKLDEAFEAVKGDSDPALRALYRSRRLSMRPSKREERRFLESLPATEQELERVYRLTYPKSVAPESVAVGKTVYGMFERAARLAHKHGVGHRAVFNLCLWSDGEVAEISWQWCDWLLEADFSKSIAVIAETSAADQMRMCGVPSVKQLTKEQALAACIEDS